jgi:hypothetical protein
MQTKKAEWQRYLKPEECAALEEDEALRDQIRLRRKRLKARCMARMMREARRTRGAR